MAAIVINIIVVTHPCVRACLFGTVQHEACTASPSHCLHICHKQAARTLVSVVLDTTAATTTTLRCKHDLCLERAVRCMHNTSPVQHKLTPQTAMPVFASSVVLLHAAQAS
eukprot:GHRR01012503.1.p1 GENE.GHRR01012503.1~~GHRR01012503.1.p1  ORF type:complete len:111 (-),score=18.93 GHRR01012503.1:1418-1750(-)